MNRRDTVRSLIAAAGAAFAPGAARPQAGFPNRPIRMVVPVSPGGGVDTFARLIAAKVKTQRDVHFFVENRTGGNARSAASMCSARRPTAAPCCSTLQRTMSRVW
jgi:tripartite-type tricarboxylate transporter receptor subunit TctC